jgi:Tfp pilus assembly protein PilV
LPTSGRESGYSLAEVLAAIVVLTVAIIPMVGMFDAALGAVSASGDYDAARSCAGQELEQMKSLPYEAVAGGLPGGTCEPSGFAYEVDREFVNADLQTIGRDRGLAKVTVTVRWDDGESYGVTGVVSRW